MARPGRRHDRGGSAARRHDDRQGDGRDVRPRLRSRRRDRGRRGRPDRHRIDTRRVRERGGSGSGTDGGGGAARSLAGRRAEARTRGWRFGATSAGDKPRRTRARNARTSRAGGGGARPRARISRRACPGEGSRRRSRRGEIRAWRPHPPCRSGRLPPLCQRAARRRPPGHTAHATPGWRSRRRYRGNPRHRSAPPHCREYGGGQAQHPALRLCRRNGRNRVGGAAPGDERHARRSAEAHPAAVPHQGNHPRAACLPDDKCAL